MEVPGLFRVTIPSRHRPFFVECKKNGRIVCKQSCMLFHSCSICAHTVAVAKQKDCLDSLLNSIAKKWGGVSITNISDGGMPESWGKKLSTKRKPSQKSSTKRIRSILAEARDESQKSRIQVPPKKKPSLVPGSSLINSTSCSVSFSQSVCSTSVAASVLGSSPTVCIQLHKYSCIRSCTL